MRLLPAVILACVAAFAPDPAPGALQQPPEEPDAHAGNAAAVLEALLEAYRSAPIAERVTVRIVHPRPPDSIGPVLDRSSVVTVRAWRGGEDGPPVLRADLGVLSLYVRGSELVAVRSDDPSTCLVRELGGPLSARTLAPVLPPLALPQIELVFGDRDAGANPTPYTRNVRWRAPEREAEGRLVLSGSSDGGEVRLVLDGATHRVLEMTVLASPGARLEVRCEPAEAGDPGGWAIEPADRRVVRSLRELGVPEAAVRTGEPVPPLPLHDLDMGVWDLEQEMADREAALPHSVPAPLILILARQRAAPAGDLAPAGVNAAAGVRAFLRGLRRSAAERDDPAALRGIPIWRPVLVFEVDAFSRERLGAARTSWAAARPTVSMVFDDAEPECLWSSAGRALLDRFVPGAETAVAVIAPDNSLMGSFAVAGSDSADEVRIRLAEVFARDERERFGESRGGD